MYMCMVLCYRWCTHSTSSVLMKRVYCAVSPLPPSPSSHLTIVLEPSYHSLVSTKVTVFMHWIDSQKKKHLFTHSHAHMRTHTYTHVCTHAYMHTCTHMYTRTHAHMHMHTHTYTHVYTHVYTHMYARTHTCTHTHR